MSDAEPSSPPPPASDAAPATTNSNGASKKTSKKRSKRKSSKTEAEVAGMTERSHSSSSLLSTTPRKGHVRGNSKSGSMANMRIKVKIHQEKAEDLEKKLIDATASIESMESKLADYRVKDNKHHRLKEKWDRQHKEHVEYKDGVTKELASIREEVKHLKLTLDNERKAFKDLDSRTSAEQKRLNSEIRDLQTANGSLTAARDTLENTVASMRAEAAKLLARQDSLSTELVEGKTHKLSLQHEHELRMIDAKNIENELRQTISGLEGKVKRNLEVIEEHKQTIEELSDQLENAHADNDSLEGELSVERAAIANLREQLTEEEETFREEKQFMVGESDQLRESIVELNGQIADLKDTIDSKDLELKQTQTHFQEKESHFVSVKESLEAQLEDMLAAVERKDIEFQEQGTNFRERIRVLEKEFNDTNDEVKTKLGEKEDALQKVIEEVDALKATKERLEDELRAKQATIDEKTHAEKLITLERDELRMRATGSEKQFNEQAGFIKRSFEETVNGLRSALDSERKSFDKMTADFREKENQLVQEKHELQREINNMKHAAQTLEEDNRSERTKLHETIRQMKLAADQETNKLAKVSQVHKSEVSQLQDRLSVKEQAVFDLTQRLEEEKARNRTAISQLERKVTTLSDKNEDQRGQLRDSEDAMARLKSHMEAQMLEQQLRDSRREDEHLNQTRQLKRELQELQDKLAEAETAKRSRRVPSMTGIPSADDPAALHAKYGHRRVNTIHSNRGLCTTGDGECKIL